MNIDQAGLVSVVIPCYEQAEYLPDALDSIEAQTYARWECIVIDDGSPTEGPEIRRICEEYGVRHLRVTNRGLPSARNTGLMNARGEAVAMLDADDWFDAAYLEKTMLLFPSADVVVTGLQECGEPPRNQRYDPGYDRPLAEVTLAALWRQNLLFYAALFRASLLRSIGGFNGRMVRGYEDYDVWLDLYSRGGVRFAEVREPLLNYRTRPDSMLQDTERNWRQWNYEEMRRHHGTVAPRLA